MTFDRADQSGGARLRVAYFVHDLSDPAVAKRVRMLGAGGADVLLYGFRRSADLIRDVAGVRAVDLGRTFDGRFVQRTLAVLAQAARTRRWAGELPKADVILARNLEMLSLAAAARRRCGLTTPLVYECLDVHRLVVRPDATGALLRSLERSLLRQAKLLIVSSPAFLKAHFDRYGLDTPTLLVENKVLGSAPEPSSQEASPGPPWRIGWFGMIRCRRSLQLLLDLVRENPELVEVTIRGRPALGEFDDFETLVSSGEGVTFAGPYAPDELPDLYGRVHFTWAIDYYEAGLNSSWLLPNRLYEGGLHDTVAIALEGVETGRWLERRSAGVRFRDPESQLPVFLRGLDAPAYARLRQAARNVPRSDLVAGADECRGLVERLGATRGLR